MIVPSAPPKFKLLSVGKVKARSAIASIYGKVLEKKLLIMIG